MFFAVVAAILIIVSCVTSEFYFFIFGMIMAIVAIMASQTFTLVDDDFVAEVNRKGEKNTVRSVSVQKNGIIYGSGSENAHTKSDGKNIPSKISSKDGKKEAPEKGNGRNPIGESISDEEGQIMDMTPSEEKKKRKEEADEEVRDINRYEKYNRQVLKKVKRKYRVRKDHRPIIIDYSESYRIKQCPAFIWRAHNKVFLLLLEKEPRRICISRDMIHNLGYKPNVPAQKEKEYIQFEKDNLVTAVFKEYLPDYLDSRVKNHPLKVKNLYTIYPDICITNRSVDTVMDLMLLNFMPQDKITESDMVNGFFKRIYAANILFKDKVYSITDYKDVVETALKEMCYAEVSRREYVLTLENLLKARLISKQYVTHYTAMRDKIRGNAE